MNILIIEDDEDKLKALQGVLQDAIEGSVIIAARSFSSGLREVILRSSSLDFILLDMSMPNYDVTSKEPSGGNPEPFAGRELLAQMKLRLIETPVIVVTMFDSFVDKDEKLSLPQLVDELKEKYSPPYFDTVYFDSRQEGWRFSLVDIIKRLRKE